MFCRVIATESYPITIYHYLTMIDIVSYTYDNMIENILKSLSFDEDEVKTYLYLLERGPLTAGALAKSLGVPRSSIYGFLKRLAGDNLVVESQKSGIKIFSAELPEKINLLFSQKMEILQKAQDDYIKILPELKSKKGEKYQTPKFQVFEGAEELKNALKDMLLYRDIKTQAYWPQKKMVEILGGEFFRYHNQERIKNNISVHAIWPQHQKVEVKNHPYFGSGKEFLREIRITPPGIDFHMGYWIYGNKIVFISSTQESFGFIVQSQEMAQMLKTQFEILWQISRPLLDKSRKFN
ncbi:MAG: transcriptional regulator TrmB [Parcubacteria group bacterium Gr01-1014_24]|nr:MAG: transcriptional regulator TrmB [Parcubacteria group bacterium Gr01-1014_24]